MLRRMRLDGHDRVVLPFAESYVQAWLGGPEHAVAATVVHGIEV